MLRTNIYIEEQLHQEIMELAKQEKSTFSQMVRNLLDEGLRIRTRARLEKAAGLMAREYANNEDLYITKSIEGDDFLE